MLTLCDHIDWNYNDNTEGKKIVPQPKADLLRGFYTHTVFKRLFYIDLKSSTSFFSSVQESHFLPVTCSKLAGEARHVSDSSLSSHIGFGPYVFYHCHWCIGFPRGLLFWINIIFLTPLSGCALPHWEKTGESPLTNSVKICGDLLKIFSLISQ